tara:strand:- start:1648 stop:1818 length:171 start_codon:yes stop_codon:yes gene_type:complete
MEGLVKALLAIGLLYVVISWTVDNPNKASSFIAKVEHAYTTTVDVVSDTFFDKEEK